MIDDGRPAVIFACKSEESTEVDPSMADIIGQPINVGLIEVTENTSDGKSKMRNGLRWLLYKLEQRHRASLSSFLRCRANDQADNSVDSWH
jgi:hypothetical protein